MLPSQSGTNEEAFPLTAPDQTSPGLRTAPHTHFLPALRPQRGTQRAIALRQARSECGGQINPVWQPNTSCLYRLSSPRKRMAQIRTIGLRILSPHTLLTSLHTKPEPAPLLSKIPARKLIFQLQPHTPPPSTSLPFLLFLQHQSPKYSVMHGHTRPAGKTVTGESPFCRQGRGQGLDRSLQ